MFDRITNNLLPPDVEINVHRAPTDESVKLLKEFEEKALGHLLDKMAIGNNVLSVTSIDLFCVPPMFDRRLFVIFKLNGETYKIDEKLPPEWESKLMDRVEFLRKVVKIIAEQVAVQLMLKLGLEKF